VSSRYRAFPPERADAFPPPQDLSDEFCVEPAGETGHVEGREGLASHGVDVGQAVRRRDGSEGPRLFDDGRQQVDGADESRLLIGMCFSGRAKPSRLRHRIDRSPHGLRIGLSPPGDPQLPPDIRDLGPLAHFSLRDRGHLMKIDAEKSPKARAGRSFRLAASAPHQTRKGRGKAPLPHGVDLTGKDSPFYYPHR
jgi:hypothetical protein